MLDHVSIVVPTHNRAPKLGRLLRSLDCLVDGPSEVLVVANQCSDNTLPVLEDWKQQAHQFKPMVVQQPDGGPGTARNVGLKYARGEVVAFIDDDCIAHPKWLTRLIDRINPDERIVGVGGRILPLHNNLISRYNTYWRILEPPETLEYLVTANCCYSRKQALEAGGFDETVRSPGGEDIALSIKLRQRELKFEFAEDAAVYHEYRNNLIDFITTFRNYGRGCSTVSRNIGGEAGSIELRGYGYFGGKSVPVDRKTREVDYGLNFPNLRLSDRVAFPILKLVQTRAYNYGWSHSQVNREIAHRY